MNLAKSGRVTKQEYEMVRQRREELVELEQRAKGELRERVRGELKEVREQLKQAHKYEQQQRAK